MSTRRQRGRTSTVPPQHGRLFHAGRKKRSTRINFQKTKSSFNVYDESVCEKSKLCHDTVSDISARVTTKDCVVSNEELSDKILSDTNCIESLIECEKDESNTVDNVNKRQVIKSDIHTEKIKLKDDKIIENVENLHCSLQSLNGENVCKTASKNSIELMKNHVKNEAVIMNIIESIIANVCGKMSGHTSDVNTQCMMNNVCITDIPQDEYSHHQINTVDEDMNGHSHVVNVAVSSLPLPLQNPVTPKRRKHHETKSSASTVESSSISQCYTTNTLRTPSKRHKAAIPRTPQSVNAHCRRLIMPSKEEEDCSSQHTNSVFQVPNIPSLRAKSMMDAAQTKVETPINEISKLRSLLETPKSLVEANTPSISTTHSPMSDVEIIPNETRRRVNSSLPLPIKYRHLIDIFEALETTMTVIRGRRKTTVLFRDIRPPVERVCKRRFTEKRLAQISYVFPDGYKISKKFVSSPTAASGEYCLSLGIIDLVQAGETMAGQPWKRKQLFQCRIRDMVCAYHDEYLCSLPIKVSMDVTTMRAWHIGFKLDQVPDVPQTSLPNLDSAASMSRADAIHSLVESKKSMVITACNDNVENTQHVPEALTNVPHHLLTKIRAKEAARNAHIKEFGDDDKQELRRLFADMPRLIPLIRSVYMSSKRRVMKESDLIASLLAKGKKLVSESSMCRQLGIIREYSPAFMSVTKVGRFEALRCDTHLNMRQVIHELRTAALREVP